MLIIIGHDIIILIWMVPDMDNMLKIKYRRNVDSLKILSKLFKVCVDSVSFYDNELENLKRRNTKLLLNITTSSKYMLEEIVNSLNNKTNYIASSSFKLADILESSFKEDDYGKMIIDGYSLNILIQYVKISTINDAIYKVGLLLIESQQRLIELKNELKSPKIKMIK